MEYGAGYDLDTAFPPYVCKGCGRTVQRNGRVQPGEAKPNKRNEDCTACAAWVRARPGKTLADCRAHRERAYTVAEPGGNMDWQRDAECQWYRDEPEMWYPVEPRQRPGDQPRVRMAKQICWKCPVRAACLDWSIANKETGVRGGTYLRNGEPWHGPKRPGRKPKVAAEKVAA